jgi:NhaC family Na+:H+ antiporter
MAKKNQNKRRQNENIVENKELSIWEALIPVIVLVTLLAYNVYVFGDDALSQSVCFIIGWRCSCNRRV